MYRASIMNLPLRTQQQACSNACVIEYYEQTVPPFVEAALAALYGDICDSAASLRIRHDPNYASTFLARKGADPIAIFLFRRHRDKVQVMNEGLQLSSMEIARFVDFAFMRFPAVSVVSFQAIKVNLQALRLPYLQTNASNAQVHIFRSRGELLRHAGLIISSWLPRR